MFDTTIVDCQRNKNNMFDTTFVSVASSLEYFLLQKNYRYLTTSYQKGHKSRQLDNNVIIYGCVQYIYI